MKTRKRKIRFKPHAKDRLCERVSDLVSTKAVITAIQNKGLKPVKCLTNSRTLYYGIVNDKPIKLIFSKVIQKVVTVLPFNYDYSFEFVSIDGRGIFKIVIFPDCFVETDNTSLLTKFYKYDPDNGGWIKCKMSVINHFQMIFQNAWEYYNLGKMRLAG